MNNLVKPNYKGIPVQKSVYLFFGKALPVVILFIITILYARKLSYEDYGRFQSVWMYTNLLNIIISFGITSLLLSSNLSSLAAFIKKNVLRIVSAYLLLLITTIIIFLLYSRNFAVTTKSLLILFVIIQSTSAVVETLLLKSNRERIVLAINSIYALLFFCWHYYILLNRFNLNNLIEGIIILSIGRFIVMLSCKQKHEYISEPINENQFFKHWIYLGLNDITGVLSRWIDKLLLVYLLTAADFAVFFNGSFEIPLFGLLVSVVGSIMLIEISKNISTREKVKQLFIESFRVLSLIVFPLFMFLLFFRHELFAIIFDHKYDASIPVFLISIFILPVRINNYSNILQYYQQGNKIMFGSLLDICIAMILMISLYPLFGTRGVAVAVVIATWCQALYYLWHSAKALHTDILSLVPLKTLLIIFMIMLLSFTCLYFSLSSFTIEKRLITGMVVTIIFILGGFFLFYKKTIRQ